MESDIQDNQVVAQSPGQQLQQAREAAGLTVAYVADQLRLTENYILWLESDQYEKLPSEPFVLGYFRGYARILGQSSDQLIEGYRSYRQQLQSTVEQVTAPTRKATPEVVEEAVATDDGSNNSKYFVAAGVLVAIWVLVSVFSGGEEKPAVSAPVETTAETQTIAAAEAQSFESQPVEFQSVESQPTEAVEQMADESVQQSQAAVEDAVVIESAEAESVAPSVTPVASNGLDQLVMDFSDECWLEVTDANGDVVAADLYQAGDTANLQGVAPFSVMLGNVRAVAVRLNGDVVETKPRGFRKTLRTVILADGTTRPAE